jgi:hypothetical protein
MFIVSRAAVCTSPTRVGTRVVSVPAQSQWEPCFASDTFMRKPNKRCFNTPRMEVPTAFSVLILKGN